MARHAFGLLFAVLCSAGAALADVAPSPPMTKDQIRRMQGVDTCKTLTPGAACTDMKGLDGHCGWFTWWWIPGSTERGTEGGDEVYASYQTQCQTVDRSVTGKNGKPATVKAFKCLVCK